MSGDIPPLEALGDRIVISGPSNSGKSTLAAAIGGRIGAPPVFLDQLRFTPGSDWVLRPEGDFGALHDAAIAGDRWVMEGNYKAWMPQRLARATGAVLLWSGRWGNLYRYMRRSLFERGRVGTLEGNRDSVKWDMVHWIVAVQPGRRAMYEETVRSAGLPLVEVEGMRGVNKLYEAWGLTRL